MRNLEEDTEDGRLGDEREGKTRKAHRRDEESAEEWKSERTGGFGVES
jgi:hypothetical protein